MARSSGFSRRTGIAGITKVVRARTSAKTVSRPTESTGSLDETTTTTSDHQEDLWLFEPRETLVDEVAGERLNGNLGGLAIADGTVDIQHNDRVTHGGIEYEVDTVVGHPEDDAADGTNSPETDFWIVDFVRRQ